MYEMRFGQNQDIKKALVTKALRLLKLDKTLLVSFVPIRRKIGEVQTKPDLFFPQAPERPNGTPPTKAETEAPYVYHPSDFQSKILRRISRPPHTDHSDVYVERATFNSGRGVILLHIKGGKDLQNAQNTLQVEQIKPFHFTSSHCQTSPKTSKTKAGMRVLLRPGRLSVPVGGTTADTASVQSLDQKSEDDKTITFANRTVVGVVELIALLHATFSPSQILDIGSGADCGRLEIMWRAMQHLNLLADSRSQGQSYVRVEEKSQAKKIDSQTTLSEEDNGRTRVPNWFWRSFSYEVASFRRDLLLAQKKAQNKLAGENGAEEQKRREEKFQSQLQEQIAESERLERQKTELQEREKAMIAQLLALQAQAQPDLNAT